MNELNNEEGVYRTAPATPGLLITLTSLDIAQNLPNIAGYRPISLDIGQYRRYRSISAISLEFFIIAIHSVWPLASRYGTDQGNRRRTIG